MSPKVRRVAKHVRKALLRKTAEPDARAAGFGMRIEGLRPSEAVRFSGESKPQVVEKVKVQEAVPPAGVSGTGALSLMPPCFSREPA